MTASERSGTSPSWLEGISRYHLLVFLGCWLGGIFDGMDSTLMSVAMPVALGQFLGTDDKAVVGPIASYVTSIFLVGWTMGGILFGVIGDKLGRVKSMILSILLYALFTGLAGLTHNWQALAACRFLTGLGIGGEMVSISTFLAEVWPSRSRAVAVGVLITSYQAGVLLAGLINSFHHTLEMLGSQVFHTDPWRITFFIGALPALLVLFLRQTMKESDKWVAARTQHLESGHEFSHMRALFRKEHARALLVGGGIFCGLLIGYWASLSWIPMWIQALLGEGGTGNERGIATMYQGVAAIVGCSMAGLFSDWLGRRTTIVFSYSGCLAASALLFLTNPVFSEAIYWQSALLGYFIGLAQAVMYIYLPELFPTLVRASGTGFCLNVGRIVTAVSVLFMGPMVNALGGYGMAAMAFALAYLLSVVAAFFGEETRGKQLRA